MKKIFDAESISHFALRGTHSFINCRTLKCTNINSPKYDGNPFLYFLHLSLIKRISSRWIVMCEPSLKSWSNKTTFSAIFEWMSPPFHFGWKRGFDLLPEDYKNYEYCSRIVLCFKTMINLFVVSHQQWNSCGVIQELWI